MKYSKKPPFSPSPSPPPPHNLNFLCRFAGEFTADLRYVGGDTKLVSLDRRGGVGLAKLLSELSRLHNSPSTLPVLKYQLPESPLLVPIASDADVTRMVKAYDEIAASGTASRLRIFLSDISPRNPNPRCHGLKKEYPHGNRVRASRCRKSPTLGFASGIPPRSNLGPNYANCQSSTKAGSAIGFSRSECKRRVCTHRCGAMAKKNLCTRTIMHHAIIRHDPKSNLGRLTPDVNCHCGLESPLDISMDNLSLSSSAEACPKFSVAPVGTNILNLSKGDQLCCAPAKSRSRVANEFHSVSRIDKSMKGLDYVDMNNEATSTPEDHETTSSASNVEKKANDAAGRIFFEEAGKSSCDLLARYSHLVDQGLQTITESDIEQIRELGSGAYGTVYYGKWKGSDVAIKRMKPGCFSGGLVDDKLVSDFWKEARLLSQLHHPNVLAFYGVVTDGPMTTLATVTEYMVNGSLKQVLQRKDRTIDRRKRLIIAMDVAFGMEYLHDKKVVHFDLKSHNLLVNMKDPRRPICKIGDLGLSKVKQRTLISGGVRGTIPWMAPELLTSENNMVTEKVDVYSFGIVMWELLTSEEPYHKMRSAEILGGMLEGSLRPEIPYRCDPMWRSLMERCWSSDPGSRPSFSEIAKELRAIAASMNIK